MYCLTMQEKDLEKGLDSTSASGTIVRSTYPNDQK